MVNEGFIELLLPLLATYQMSPQTISHTCSCLANLVFDEEEDKETVEEKEVLTAFEPIGVILAHHYGNASVLGAVCEFLTCIPVRDGELWWRVGGEMSVVDWNYSVLDRDEAREIDSRLDDCSKERRA